MKNSESDAIFTARRGEYKLQEIKMAASRFAVVTDEEIENIKENSVPTNTKKGTKFGVKLFKGNCSKTFIVCNNFTLLTRVLILTETCYNFRVRRHIISQLLFSTEWFTQQNFSTEFEKMTVDEMNRCLSRFYVSVRKTDRANYKKTSLLAIRAAIDRHLKSPPYNCKFSICDSNLFCEANKTLNSYLKHLANTGQIAGTVHKNPLTKAIIAKLYEEGELGPYNTLDPCVLLQTAWFYISLHFGKRGRENKAAMHRSVLRLVKTATGEEYFELNKAEPGTVLTSKNHTGGLHGTEDHSDGKIFPLAGSMKCPVNTIKAFLSHLNPESEALFQRPKEVSTKFNPAANLV